MPARGERTGRDAAPALTPPSIGLRRASRRRPLLVVGALAPSSSRVSTTAASRQRGIAVAFAVFIALGESCGSALPGGREAAPIGTAGALAYALLAAFGGTRPTTAPLQVVAVVAVGHAGRRRSRTWSPAARPASTGSARRLLAVGVAAALFRRSLARRLPGRRLQRGRSTLAARGRHGGGRAGHRRCRRGCSRAAVRAGARPRSVRAPSLRDELRALVGLGAAIGATGVLIALAGAAHGLLGAAGVRASRCCSRSSRSAATPRSARPTLQTIRALSRVTELGGYTETGHSRRVSDAGASPSAASWA